MRSAARAWLGLLLCLLLGLPTGLAAVQLDIVDLRILSQSGQELEWVPRDETVRVAASVKNLGDETFEGAIAARFELRSRDAIYHHNETAGSTEKIRPGRAADVELLWLTQPPRPLGEYDLSAQLENDPARRFAALFRVADEPLPAGNLAQRALDYWWFFATFLGTFVLFAAVRRVRKT